MLKINAFDGTKNQYHKWSHLAFSHWTENFPPLTDTWILSECKGVKLSFTVDRLLLSSWKPEVLLYNIDYNCDQVALWKSKCCQHVCYYSHIPICSSLKDINTCVEMKTSISSLRVPSRRTVLCSQPISCFNLVLHNYKPSIIQTFGFGEFGTKVLIKHLLVWV